MSHIKRYLWLSRLRDVLGFRNAVHLIARALAVRGVQALLWLNAPWGRFCCWLPDEIAMIPVEVSNARAA